MIASTYGSLIPCSAQTELDKTMDSQVSIVPITACEGIDELVQRRQEEVETLQDEVARLGDTLRESVTK